MATSKPRAYSLALKQMPLHEAAYSAIKARLAGDGALARVRTFEGLLGRVKPAINMTLAGCVRFLETGKWLNVYEKVALKVGASHGAAFERAVREELQEWYEPRRDIERLLGLRRDTHYAALNLGGAGPDYGNWCVRLDRGIPLRFATTFAGDPLRWVFDDDGNQVLTDTEVLQRFATHDNRNALAASHNEQTLFADAIIDETALQTLLEDRETLIEVHIHGKVSSGHAVEIAVRRTVYEKFARLSVKREWRPNRLSEPTRGSARVLGISPLYLHDKTAGTTCTLGKAAESRRRIIRIARGLFRSSSTAC